MGCLPPVRAGRATTKPRYSIQDLDMNFTGYALKKSSQTSNNIGNKNGIVNLKI
jgi:hypothetical protein